MADALNLRTGPLLEVSVCGSPSYSMRSIVSDAPRDAGVALVTIRHSGDERIAQLLAAAPQLREMLSVALELLKNVIPYPGQEDLLSECIEIGDLLVAATGSAS